MKDKNSGRGKGLVWVVYVVFLVFVALVCCQGSDGLLTLAGEFDILTSDPARPGLASDKYPEAAVFAAAEEFMNYREPGEPAAPIIEASGAAARDAAVGDAARDTAAAIQEIASAKAKEAEAQAKLIEAQARASNFETTKAEVTFYVKVIGVFVVIVVFVLAMEKVSELLHHGGGTGE